MILTITPNTALDRVLFLPEVRRDRRNQVETWVECMGGKGCDVSLVLRALGEETVATGLAAGTAGRRAEVLLRAAGVTPDFVWTDGETRVNTVVIETATGHHTTLCGETLQPDRTALPGLRQWIERWAPSAEGVVIAGSLPPGWAPTVYADLIDWVRNAARSGCPVVVDAAGANLEAALSVGVDGIKPNRDELEALFGALPTPEDVLAASEQLRFRGARWVLATLGEDGAVLVGPTGAWFASAPQVTVVSPAGAGDGACACLARGLVRGHPPEEILRNAVAVSAAVVAHPRTAEFDRTVAAALVPKVEVRTLNGSIGTY